MISRAKTYYDTVNGFAQTLREDDRVPFGDIWIRTFDLDSQSSSLATDQPGSKKAYWWSLLGDWTLRLRYESGLGVLRANGHSLEGGLVHADESWIDGWNFQTDVNDVAATGDFDGDGVDEFVVTSDWGRAIVEREGGRWTAPVVS